MRRPLSGARDLIRRLHDGGVPFGIATSGVHPEIDASLEVLGIPAGVIVIDRGDVLRAKPEPDLFLACQERMGVRREDCYVVGDAVWDLLAARRAGMLSVGLLSGGYGEDELIAAGAFRVYRDAQELLESLDELGITLPELSTGRRRRSRTAGAIVADRSADQPTGIEGSTMTRSSNAWR